MATGERSVFAEAGTWHAFQGARPALRSHSVHVWRACLESDPLVPEQTRPCLSRDELERAGRFRFAADKRRYMAGRTILRCLLALYTSIAPGELEFEYNAAGKPALAGSPLRFNLSHAGDLALYAITLGLEVGVDIERIDPGLPCERLAERFFTPREHRALMALPQERRPEAFAHVWTCKEAYLKARGDGLRIPLDSFDVSAEPDSPATLNAGADPLASSRWQIIPLFPGEGYAGALVAENCPLWVHLYQWSWTWAS